MVTLSNEDISVSIKAEGAELTSLKKLDFEYLWQADPQYWKRHAPVLFPIVGRLKDDTYTLGETNYSMGQHGFARDVTFELSNQTDTEATFTLSSSEGTKTQYPFDFMLTVKYSIEANELRISYRVENTGATEMPFSIGGHPAFKCPLMPDKQRQDYRLLFEKQETLETYRLKKGLFSGQTKAISNKGAIEITDDLFDKDALVFKNLSSTYVTLADVDNREWVKFDFSGFPYLGIWSKNDQSPFICIEPWHGLADHADHNGQLAEKEGIVKLLAGETFEAAYGVTLI